MAQHPEKKLSGIWRKTTGKTDAPKSPAPALDDTVAENYADTEAAHGMTDEPSPERLRDAENPSLLW